MIILRQVAALAASVTVFWLIRRQPKKKKNSTTKTKPHVNPKNEHVSRPHRRAHRAPLDGSGGSSDEAEFDRGHAPRRATRRRKESQRSQAARGSASTAGGSA